MYVHSYQKDHKIYYSLYPKKEIKQCCCRKDKANILYHTDIDQHFLKENIGKRIHIEGYLSTSDNGFYIKTV